MTVDHGDNLDTHMRLMAVKWHKTCKLKYNKSRLSREKAKASAEHNKEEKEIYSDELIDMIQWIQKERNERKPFCHFIWSDLWRKFKIKGKEAGSGFHSTRLKNELLRPIQEITRPEVSEADPSNQKVTRSKVSNFSKEVTN